MDGMLTALDLLRKLQWRGDGYSCISCVAMHRDGCKPGCEVTALLENSMGGLEVIAISVNAGMLTVGTKKRKHSARR